MRPLALALAVAFAAPATAGEGEPLAPWLEPVQSHVETRPRWGLVITGLALLGGTYLLNASIGYVADEGRLAIPIVGPLLYGEAHGALGLMVVDSLLQATGAALAVAGAVARVRVTVFDRFALVPTVGPGGGGLAASGRF